MWLRDGGPCFAISPRRGIQGQQNNVSARELCRRSRRGGTGRKFQVLNPSVNASRSSAEPQGRAPLSTPTAVERDGIGAILPE